MPWRLSRVVTGPAAELKIEPKVESQEPVDVNLGGGEGSASKAGSSSQSGGVSRPDSLGSYPKASVGVKRKWSEKDLMIEKRGLKREPDVELAELDREIRDDNKRIDVKPDIAGLVSGLTCDSSLSETPLMTCTKCMQWLFSHLTRMTLFVTCLLLR